MSGLGAHTGNSAEDKMSNAAGCLAVAALVIVAALIGCVVALVRWLA